MKFSYSSLTLTAGLLLQSTSVLAHGYVQDLKIGNDWYVGSLPFSDQWKQPPAQRVTWPFYANGNGPVVDVTKHDIVCNTITTPGALDAPIAAGQQVTFYWTDWPSGHKGPVMTYLGYCGENTPCSSIQDPASLSYFKIDHKGYDKANGRWAAEELIANNNSWTVTIPSDIKAGYYLIRHEILALQEAAVPVSGQFYPSCSNLKVTGGGSALPQGVKFPGAYSNEDPGIHINIYTGFNGDYVIPGPDVYGGGGSGSNSNSGNNDDNYDTGSSSGENSNEGEQPVVETSAAPESSPLSTQSAVSSPVSSSQAPPPPPPPPTNEKHDSAAVYEEGSKVGTFVTSFVDYVPSPTSSSVPPPPSSSSSSSSSAPPPPPPPPSSSTQAPVSTFSYRHKHHAHSSVVQQQPPKPENNGPVIETVVVTATSSGPEAPKAPEQPPKQENNGGTIIETVVVTATSPSEPKPSPDTPQQQENPPQQEDNGPVYKTVVVTVTSSSAGPKVTEVVHEEPAPQPNKDQDENAHWVIETVYAPSVVVTVEVTETEVVVATAYA